MTDSIDRDNEIDKMLAERDIKRVLLRYCRGVDRLDPDLITSIYHAGANDNHGVFSGEGKEFAKRITSWDWFKDATAMSHVVTNMSIDVHGLTADSEAYITAFHYRTLEDGSNAVGVFSGRYVDQFESREGVWKITDRVIVHDWTAVLPVSRTWSSDLEGSSFVQGLRGRDDITYSRQAG
jgi:SnoaL-like domain